MNTMQRPPSVNSTDMLLGNSVTDLKKDNEFLQAIHRLFDGKNKHIDLITQLEPQEIVNISRIRVLEDWADGHLDYASVFVEAFMRMKVSEKRKGRLEFFETFKPVMQGAPQQQEGGFFSRLFSPRPPQ